MMTPKCLVNEKGWLPCEGKELVAAASVKARGLWPFKRPLQLPKAGYILKMSGLRWKKLNESQANAREILRNNLMNSREGFTQPLLVFCEWPNSQDAPDHTWRSWSHYGSVIWDPEQVPQPPSGASRPSPVHGDAVLGMGQEANAVTDLEVPYTWKALFVCIILNLYFPIRRVPEFPLVVLRVMQLVMNHSGSSEALQSLSLGRVNRV